MAEMKQAIYDHFQVIYTDIGWFNQIHYMRGCRQDRILFLQDPALPAVSFYFCRRGFQTPEIISKA